MKQIFVSRSILKHLILDSVASQSEATVVNFMQFSELLVKEYSDYFPLACLWQACILSEWFTGMYLLHAFYAYIFNTIIYLILLSLLDFTCSPSKH